MVLIGVCLDAAFLIDLLRDERAATAKMSALEESGELVVLPTPVLYEVLAGLFYSRSKTEAAAFRSIASDLPVADFDENAAFRAAEVRAELKRLGRLKGSVDIMIAGIAAARGHRLVTRDKDFVAIAETLQIQTESY